MPSEATQRIPDHDRYVIVEVEGFEGADGSIVVTNYRAPRMGAGDKLYCLGVRGSGGIVQFVDWGYATIDEARAAIGDRASRNGATR